MESNPVSAYHTLFASIKEPLLYTAPWWLDATCGHGGWGAIVRRDIQGLPVAALPYHHTRIRGLSALVTPPFTQWISLLGGGEPHVQLSLALMAELPKSSILDLSLRPDTFFRIPESAFPITLKYSFVIAPGVNNEDHRKGYNEGLRRNIRQAEKQYVVETSEDIAGFLSLCRQSYEQRKMKPPPWLDTVVPRVHSALSSHHCGTLTLATSNGKPIAGVLTAWDHSTTYYLAGGRTADEQGASAHALLLDHAIRVSHDRGTVFDFEGSMHPGIANFFQSFGAVPAAYWHIRKYQGVGKLWSLLGK
ncbi:MAG: GNAT family N-acetyltransferase [Saprospiraceae bacterium]|nr:GNAT family N-acetyltransferase [Saprospiraceae bacterium]